MALDKIKIEEALNKNSYWIEKLSDPLDFLEKSMATYNNWEKYLYLKGFDILSFFEDSRRDDGDDGGYIISISKKNDLFYIHILQANYNCDLIMFNLKQNESEYLKCFYSFEKAESVQEFLNKFANDLLYCCRELKENSDNFFGESEEEFQELSKREDFNWDENYCKLLNICFSAFEEYQEDSEKIRNLCGFNNFVNNRNTLQLKQKICLNKFEILKSKVNILKERLDKNNFNDLDRSDIKLIKDYIDKYLLKGIEKRYLDISINSIFKGRFDYFTLDYIDYNPILKKDHLNRNEFNTWDRNYIEPKKFKDSIPFEERFNKIKIDFNRLIEILFISYWNEFLE